MMNKRFDKYLYDNMEKIFIDVIVGMIFMIKYKDIK